MCQDRNFSLSFLSVCLSVIYLQMASIYIYLFSLSEFQDLIFMMAEVSLVLFTDVPSTCGHSEYAFRTEFQYLCKVLSLSSIWQGGKGRLRDHELLTHCHSWLSVRNRGRASFELTPGSILSMCDSVSKESLRTLEWSIFWGPWGHKNFWSFHDYKVVAEFGVLGVCVFLMLYYYMRLHKSLDYCFTVKISKDIFLSFLKASICSLAEEENMVEP